MKDSPSELRRDPYPRYLPTAEPQSANNVAMLVADDGGDDARMILVMFRGSASGRRQADGGGCDRGERGRRMS